MRDQYGGPQPAPKPAASTSSSSSFASQLQDAISGVTGSSASAAGYLPNGNYDIYNLGTLYDKTVFLGTPEDYSEAGQRAVAGGYDTSKLTKQTGITSTNTEQYMREFAGWSITSPGDFADLQVQLYKAGAYGSSKPNFGVYGTDDAAAMKRAMSGYLGVVNPNDAKPLTLSDYLDRLSAQGAANGIGGGSSGPTRAPLQLTPDATLGAALNNQAGQNLGRNASDTEAKGFSDKYHGEETAAYNGGPDNPGAVTAEAQTFTQTGASNAEYQTHLQAGYSAKILSMLGVQ